MRHTIRYSFLFWAGLYSGVYGGVHPWTSFAYATMLVFAYLAVEFIEQMKKFTSLSAKLEEYAKFNKAYADTLNANTKDIATLKAQLTKSFVGGLGRPT